MSGPLRWSGWTGLNVAEVQAGASIVHKPGLDGMTVGQRRRHNHAGPLAEWLGKPADELVGLGRLERNRGGLAAVLNDGAGVLCTRGGQRLVGLIREKEHQVRP